ncbi:MAG: DUF2892 domain-containing protein [Alphaproteobacteria bacterium]|nr:DUF2892 domain-containing protein [Alphaproteobacteria bacterium]MDE2112705.1 DUF2892 domain-containing protein [Alphaproteobacteria bacterium]MDE2494736.1 DUF2892 domain-containing protein [Alphaproteobacteria bacterium]
MIRNVGPIDRIARIIVGLTLVALAIFQLLDPWAWIGVVPLVTGVIGWCPAYLPLGITTCKSA